MKIFLAITGSIAACRTTELIRALKAAGHELEVCLTYSAEKFVGRTSIETFLEKKILSNDCFAEDKIGTDHIAKARSTEAILVYGATANFLAKIAHGMADDFISLQILASRAPLFLAPAMNTHMWNAPATQHNMDVLKTRGALVIGPIAGDLACGESGIGHVADTDEIVQTLLQADVLKDYPRLPNLSVLISLGAMSSPIDLARRITNESSGQMGLELARAFRMAGAQVTLLAGTIDSQGLEALKSFSHARFSSPADYAARLDEFVPECDVFVSAAAVLDFEVLSSPKKLSREKIAEKNEITLSIRPVEDFVAKYAGQTSSKQKVIAFALEDGSVEEVLQKATAKLEKKKAHALLANRFSTTSGPNTKTNEMWLVTRGAAAPIHFSEDSKSKLSKRIVSALARTILKY